MQKYNTTSLGIQKTANASLEKKYIYIYIYLSSRLYIREIPCHPFTPLTSEN